MKKNLIRFVGFDKALIRTELKENRIILYKLTNTQQISGDGGNMQQMI